MEKTPGGETIVENEINAEEYEKTPWLFKEFRKLEVGSKFRTLLILGGVALYFYLFYQWFGAYFLFGFLPAPVWFIWALRQIDQESFTILEFRIKGDQRDDTIISRDTQTNIYNVPPDVWKKVKVRGTPYHLGSRIYVCDKFEENEKGEWTVIFPDDPQLANINFYTRIKLWLELKNKIPKLMEDTAIYRHNIRILAMERSIDILEKTQALTKTIREPESMKKAVIRPKGGEPYFRENGRTGTEPGRGDQ